MLSLIFSFIRRSPPISEVLNALQHGADPDAVIYFGMPPVAICTNTDTVTLLIKYGADVNFRNDVGETPLFYASYYTSKILLKNNANVHVRDNNGNTPLHSKIKLSLLFDKQAELYIRYGVDVNAQNDKGKTALHLAKQASLVTLLLKHGADPNIKDNYGHAPIVYAFSSKIYKLLRRHMK